MTNTNMDRGRGWSHPLRPTHRHLLDHLGAAGSQKLLGGDVLECRWFRRRLHLLGLGGDLWWLLGCPSWLGSWGRNPQRLEMPSKATGQTPGTSPPTHRSLANTGRADLGGALKNPAETQRANGMMGGVIQQHWRAKASGPVFPTLRLWKHRPQAPVSLSLS